MKTLLLLAILLVGCNSITPSAQTKEELLSGNTSKTWTTLSYKENSRAQDLIKDKGFAQTVTFKKDGTSETVTTDKNAITLAVSAKWTVKDTLLQFTETKSVLLNSPLPDETYTIQELTSTSLVLIYKSSGRAEYKAQ